LSATATEHCRSMRPSTPAPAQSSVKRLLATPPRNSSPFLGQLIALENKGGDIHIILDNLSTHKTQRVRDFLAEHPNVLLHFTPTYSSWLNQVEIWFSKIERDAIARGVFTSVGDLSRKLMRDIRHHNRTPKPIKWAYRDPAHTIMPTFDSAVTVH